MDLIEIEKMIAEATVKLEAENARLREELAAAHAVLEAQGKQEEVGYVGEYVLPTKNLKAGTPLYAAPVVQPDCNTCTHRGRINGLSQETYCEQCKWHSGVDHYAAAEGKK